MSRINLILWAVAITVIAFFYWQSDRRGQEIVKLKAEIGSLKKELTGCRDEIKKSNQAANKAEKQISEIKTVVKTVKSNCNCYDSPIDDAILGRVRGK